MQLRQELRLLIKWHWRRNRFDPSYHGVRCRFSRGCLEFTQSLLASFLDEAEHRQQRPRRPRWDRGSFPPYRWLLDPASRSAGDNFYSNWAIQCFWGVARLVRDSRLRLQVALLATALSARAACRSPLGWRLTFATAKPSVGGPDCWHLIQSLSSRLSSLSQRMSKLSLSRFVSSFACLRAA